MVVLAALTCGLGARALPALAGDPGRGETPSERAAPQDPLREKGQNHPIEPVG